MFRRTKQRGAKVLAGLVIAGTLAGGVGVAVAAAAPGGPRGGGLAQEAVVENAPLADLSEAEKEDILFMREEEKLARDVYQTFYKQYDLPVFGNIASSEQAHIDAVKTLIERYGLEDPAEGLGVGQFANQELQALYEDLVDAGRASLADALRVGALIEEIDILDLQASMDQTDALDVERVYENLMRGSRNHLRAFVSALERQTGEAYGPMELSVEAYEEILGGDVETGRSEKHVGRGAEAGRGSRGAEGTWLGGPGQEDGRGPQGSGRGQSSAGSWRGGGQPSGRGTGEGECLQ